METIVTGQGDQSSPGVWEREEDLNGSIFPHRGVTQLRQVGLQNIEGDSFVVSIESETSHQQDNQHDVGEQCSEVHHLNTKKVTRQNKTIRNTMLQTSTSLYVNSIIAKVNFEINLIPGNPYITEI